MTGHALSLQVNRGSALENLVALTLAAYEERGVALVRKVPEPWKVVRRGGRVAGAFPERKGLVDYIGVWRGRGVAFDCKECGTRLEFSKVPPHQLRFLLGWESCGGLAGLVAWFWREGAFAWLPAGEAARALAEGKRGLGAGECLRRGLPVREGRGAPLDLAGAWKEAAKGTVK